MFPLSNPTHSGLAFDLVSLAIVLAGLLAFVAGLDDLRRRVRPNSTQTGSRLDAVTLAAYAVLALVGLAVAVMLAGAPGIPVAQAVFLAVAAWGFVAAARHAARLPAWWRSASTSDVVRTLALGGAACWSIWFWAVTFQDHVALPSCYDGISHAAWYLRILDAGVPTLGRVPILFPAIFGTQTYEFYPTGMHAFIAIASGFWGQWGVLSHAVILKAWFTLAVAAAPWGAFWMARRLVPRMPWWIGLALVFLAIPGFRFPVEAAHEGGASRIFAHVLLVPVYADVLLGRFDDWRWQGLAGLCLGMAFLMHPGAFVTLAALLACAGVCAAFARPAPRSRLSVLATPAIGVAIGGAVAVGLLRWNAMDVFPRAIEPFTWARLWQRLATGWTTLFESHYLMGPAKMWPTLAGLLLLLVRRRALGISWRPIAFVASMVLVAAVALAAHVVSLPGMDLVGAAFYDETPRVIEVFYEPVALCLVAVMCTAWNAVAAWAAVPRAPLWRARFAPLLALALVVGTAGYQYARRGFVRDHVRSWDRIFRTSRISQLQGLGEWIERHTEPDAIVFHLPFDSEVWEAWTGRVGSFMNGECHSRIARAPCTSRKALVTGRIDSLRETLERGGSLAGRCLAEIDRFDRPAYFLVPSSSTVPAGLAVCSDARYVTTLDGRAVIAYRRPQSDRAGRQETR